MAEKKTIILGMPKSFDIYKKFIKNLEFHNYSVYSVCIADNTEFKYKNFLQRLHNFFRKTFLNDKEFKNKLKLLAHEKEILKIVSDIKSADFSILIRPDMYTFKIIEEIKKKTTKSIAYQWDGLNRFPTIYSYLDKFDSFYIFDENDIGYKKHLIPLTNFYFDYDNNHDKIIVENDVFFLGTYIPERMKDITKFIEETQSLNLKYDINIFGGIGKKSSLKIENKNINILDMHMNYHESITKLKNSKIALDFLNKTHNGLSLRTFEALFYEKKLITNNESILKYDFYHPDNIFVWGIDNIDDLTNFIVKPYHQINKNIKEKYSFKNWIDFVLGIDGATPITIPV